MISFKSNRNKNVQEATESETEKKTEEKSATAVDEVHGLQSVIDKEKQNQKSVQQTHDALLEDIKHEVEDLLDEERRKQEYEVDGKVITSCSRTSLEDLAEEIEARESDQFKHLPPGQSPLFLNKEISKFSDASVHSDFFHPQEKEKYSWKDYRRYLVMPNSKRLLAWDIFMLLILMFVAFYLPYRVSFLQDNNDVPDGLLVFETLIDASFWMDIALNFMTAYEDEESGVLVTDPHKISVRYLRGFFILDFIATFPFSAVVETSTGANKIAKLGRLPRLIRILKVLRLLKLLRIYKLNEIVMKLETNYGLHQGLSQITLIIGVIFVVTHLVGCLWYFIALEDDYASSCMCEVDWQNNEAECSILEEEGSLESIPNVDLYCPWVWRLGYHLQSGNSEKYIASIYWALSSLTTVGYGDISGATENEQMYCMIVMIIGVSWYAYIVSSVSTIMKAFDDKKRIIREHLTAIHSFARDKKLPTTLAREIQIHAEYRLEMNPWLHLAGSYDHDAIMKDLSPKLRIEVINHVERGIVQKLQFLEGKEQAFIADFVVLLTPQRLEANRYLFKEGTYAEEMFFLTSGTVALLVQSESGPLRYRNFYEGSHFGDLGCIVGGFYEYSIKAQTACEIQVITKRNMLTVLVANPEVFEDLRLSAFRMRARLKLFQENDMEEQTRVYEEEMYDANWHGRPIGQPKNTSLGLAKGGIMSPFDYARTHYLEKIPFSPAKLSHRNRAFNLSGKQRDSTESRSSEVPPTQEARQDPLKRQTPFKNFQIKPKKPDSFMDSLDSDKGQESSGKMKRQFSFSNANPLRLPSITVLLEGSEDNFDKQDQAPNNEAGEKNQEALERYIDEQVDKVLQKALPRIEKMVAESIDKVARAAANLP